MDRLFSPCTRLHAMLESEESQSHLDRFNDRPEDLQELNLDVSTERLLSAEREFSYTDLYAMLGNENAVVWMTPHAAVVPEGGKGLNYCRRSGDQPWRFSFSADGKDIVAMARSNEHVLEICHIIVRLLAASTVRSVILRKWKSIDGALINAPTLGYLMEKCQNLQVLTLEKIVLNKSHGRVIGAYSRPDLEINLDSCKFTSAGASALAEVLGRNQGPTSLTCCKMDYSVLANGLRGNSRLKILRSHCLSSSSENAKRQRLAIASALQENKGLVELNVNHGDFAECDGTWYAFCDSLKTHPTLEVLRLHSENNNTPTVLALITSRIQALLDMMKMNMSIHTIHLSHRYSHEEFFRGSVIPYLETNRLRPRVSAIQKARPIPYRVGVLGRALLAARSDANSFWMLLSGNAEVAFPSRTTTIEVAASLPTSTTAAAITNVAAAVTATTTIEVAASLPTPATATAIVNVAAAVTASAKLALTNSATASLPSAATPTAIGTLTPSTAYTSDSAVVAAAPNDATPCTGQKRRARP
jgi:hypothetical protein